DVHDGCGLRRPEGREDRVSETDRGEEVEREAVMPRLVGDRPRPFQKRARTARVVHEDVETAERRERLCRDRLHAFARGDVAGDEGCRRGCILVGCTCSDYDFGAGIEKALRNGRADAACASGDKSTAAGEFFREIEWV